ncbi:MAG: alpha/beta fold hydrolase [Comamonadaceae bacterium]|nr:MAG: alpha/beta fold hydrolase [Comamonadaceae bacterium]
MTESQHAVHVEHGFALERGGTLAEARIAYLTRGTLTAARDNVVLVAHGYTSSHSFIEPDSPAAEGSWSELIGPGRAIDTDRFFVIASNALGSCYGSTGPGSIDPATGAPYGPAFPRITLHDIVRLQHALLQSMGIARMHAVVGVSMGGFQALQWGVQFPAQVERLVVALSALQGSQVSASGSAGLIAAMAAEPGWNGGRFEAGAMQDVLARLRVGTLQRYGMAAWLADQPLPAARQLHELQHAAQAWASSFDAHSLITLMQAIEAFDVRPQIGAIQARLLLVLCTSDELFPASTGPAMVQALQRADVRVQFIELESRYGHLASGMDWQKWEAALKLFLDR